MKFAAVVKAPLRSGHAPLRAAPTTANGTINRQGFHLTEAKRCLDKPGHFRMLRDFLRGEGVAIGRYRVVGMIRRMGIVAIYRRPNPSREWSLSGNNGHCTCRLSHLKFVPKCRFGLNHPSCINLLQIRSGTYNRTHGSNVPS